MTSNPASPIWSAVAAAEPVPVGGRELHAEGRLVAVHVEEQLLVPYRVA